MIFSQSPNCGRQILDKPNAASDRQLARHLVSLYYKEPVVPKSPLEQDFLMDYIAYTRRHIQPEVGCSVRNIYMYIYSMFCFFHRVLIAGRFELLCKLRYSEKHRNPSGFGVALDGALLGCGIESHYLLPYPDPLGSLPNPLPHAVSCLACCVAFFFYRADK